MIYQKKVKRLDGFLVAHTTFMRHENKNKKQRSAKKQP